MNELLYLYLTAKSNWLVKVQKHLGTFIQYIIADAAQVKYEEKFISIDWKLRSMMNLKELNLDLLNIAQFLGLNDFSMYKPNRLNDDALMKCIHKYENEFYEKKSDVVKLWESHKNSKLSTAKPCINGTFQGCKDYCSWYNTYFKKWKRKRSIALQRYLINI